MIVIQFMDRAHGCSVFSGLTPNFSLWQRAHALSTIEGYSGYGAEQGEKVIGFFFLQNYSFVRKLLNGYILFFHVLSFICYILIRGILMLLTS